MALGRVSAIGRGMSLESASRVSEGMELSLVRTLTELHGGTISVERKLDHGSVFSVALPFATPQRAIPRLIMAVLMGVGPAGEGRTFPVLWDEGNRVADSFGLKHDFSDATRDLYSAAEVNIEEINGAEAGWTLPLASTYIVDKAGMIHHAVVTADWRIRPDPNATLEALKRAVADQ